MLEVLKLHTNLVISLSCLGIGPSIIKHQGPGLQGHTNLDIAIKKSSMELFIICLPPEFLPMLGPLTR